MTAYTDGDYDLFIDTFLDRVAGDEKVLGEKSGLARRTLFCKNKGLAGKSSAALPNLDGKGTSTIFTDYGKGGNYLL